MYNKPRVIPVLSIIGNDLVKTEKFKNPRYLGDPVNAVKIFNGKYVDELVICDIRATKDNTPVNFPLLKNIASQAFMPLGYGGGIKTLDEAKLLYKTGFEKLIFSTQLHDNPELIKECVKHAGSQSVVASVDIKKNTSGSYNVFVDSGTRKVSDNLIEYIEEVVSLGVGELIISFIDRESQMNGYDLEIIKEISKKVSIPTIPLGGAKNIVDFQEAIKSGAHGVAAGSMFVFYGPRKAILITYSELL